jgi:long-chain fatty acid transport protein
MRLKKIAALLALAGAAAPALATNGYFAHGYGMKALGMAGAATAVTGDAFGGANNPATMVYAGNRLDLGVYWFSPIRENSRSGSAFGMFDSKQESGSEHFFIPELGYNRMLNPNMSIGVTVYGNGGMNTDYSQAGNDAGACSGGFPSGSKSANMLCGNSRLGVDLMQLVIAPTFAMKFGAHALGVAPLLGYQRFKAEGLQAFAAPAGSPQQASQAPGSVTNNGYDSSTGYGVRVGWLSKFGDSVSVGAAYSTKMRMKDLDKYAGLFAENGGFDLPENYSLGVSFRPMPALNIALDYQVINYSEIRSVGNPSTNQALLGTAGGPGFGWDDVKVVKLGAEYQVSKGLTVRAGFSWGENPIQARDAMFNILAPAVVKNHATLGFTYSMGGGDLTVAYMHAFKEELKGPDGLGAGGTNTLQMYENALGVAYGIKF